ncbi:unnamed protein product [Mytilus coruscus]|uniref:Uncharacterized protein n=1 Tax=Mytilus coruscus TaxID=42192 RepID=A0A6J8EGM9_MYTCO|nr:unnamed protein product [Mytilus coruscus]
MNTTFSKSELLTLSSWTAGDVADIINKRLTTGLSCITTAQYALLYMTIAEMDVEEILRFAISAMRIPKWSNVSRTVTRNLLKKEKITEEIISAAGKSQIRNLLEKHKNNNLCKNLHNCNVEIENRKQENIILNRVNKIVSDELNSLQNENKKVITKDPDSKRYTDDLRTCIFELQGYKVIAKEDSETVANMIKDTLQESASYQNVNVQKFLLSLSAMMSDRSSVMKKTNQIIDEWRSSELSQQLNEVEVQKPYWNLINSNEKNVDLYKFVRPLQSKLAKWKINYDEMFDRNMKPLFENYPHVTDEIVLNAAMRFQNVKSNLNKICDAMLQIVERQLRDNLENGIYVSADVQLQQRTSHSKLTNIPDDNLFGDLDFSMRKKNQNATFRHHSSVSMLKRNKTLHG